MSHTNFFLLIVWQFSINVKNKCGNIKDAPCHNSYFEVLWAAVEITGAEIYDLP